MAWQKGKIRPEQELVVGGWMRGTGKAEDLGALLVGVYEDGMLRYAGKVGAGFRRATRPELIAALAPPATDAPPFSPPPPRIMMGLDIQVEHASRDPRPTSGERSDRDDRGPRDQLERPNPEDEQGRRHSPTVPEVIARRVVDAWYWHRLPPPRHRASLVPAPVTDQPAGDAAHSQRSAPVDGPAGDEVSSDAMS